MKRLLLMSAILALSTWVKAAGGDSQAAQHNLSFPGNWTTGNCRQRVVRDVQLTIEPLEPYDHSWFPLRLEFSADVELTHKLCLAETHQSILEGPIRFSIRRLAYTRGLQQVDRMHQHPCDAFNWHLTLYLLQMPIQLQPASNGPMLFVERKIPQQILETLGVEMRELLELATYCIVRDLEFRLPLTTAINPGPSTGYCLFPNLAIKAAIERQGASDPQSLSQAYAIIGLDQYDGVSGSLRIYRDPQAELLCDLEEKLTLAIPEQASSAHGFFYIPNHSHLTLNIYSRPPVGSDPLSGNRKITSPVLTNR